MGIAKGERHGPSHVGPARDLLVAFIGYAIGRIANAEHGVEQQLSRSRTGAHD